MSSISRVPGKAALSLATKTLVALSAAVLPALAVAVVLGYVLITSVGEAKLEFERADLASRRLTEIRVLFEKEHGLIARLPAELDLKMVDRYERQLDIVDRSIAIEIAGLARGGEIVSRHTLDELRNTRRGMRETTARLLEATRSFAQTTGTELVRDWEDRAQVLRILLDSAGANAQRVIAQARMRLQASSQHAWRLTPLALLGALLSVALGIWLIRRQFIRPVTALTDHVLRIRDTGDLDLRRDEWMLARHDEIGTLSRSFDLLIAELADARHRMIAWSEAEIRTHYERLDAAINSMPLGLCMFDREQKLIIANRRYAELYGLDPGLLQAGVPLRAFLEQRAALCTDGDPADYVNKRLAVASMREPWYVTNTLRDGRIVAISHLPLANGGSIAVHQDVTEQRKAEERVAYLAHHDTLTSLANRARFREELSDALQGLGEGDTLAVICLDLDQFKAVNDTLGHPVGDMLLREVATRIQACLRPEDIAARLGGDEFAVIVMGGEPVSATTLAARIVRELGEPFTIEGHHIVVGASVGIAIAPHDGREPDHLIKNADLALYRAKEDGRGTYRFFEAGMDERMQARRALELDLRRAVAEGEFELFYQPLVRLASNEISGFEALLRWRHAERGLISPAEFVPLAEEIGLIGHIGAWVLRTACAEASEWPRDMKVAVNLSPVQFRKETVVLDVIAALGASGLSPRRLELEITESVLLQETEATLTTLNQLRGLGVRISMDDFGTGYSSLAYLRKFPFDKIKIDRSFTRELPAKADAIAIIRAVAGLGNTLGIVTTVEGVETIEQLQTVRHEGCTEVQGYLISEPRPAHELPELMRRHALGRSVA